MRKSLCGSVEYWTEYNYTAWSAIDLSEEAHLRDIGWSFLCAV